MVTDSLFSTQHAKTSEDYETNFLDYEDDIPQFLHNSSALNTTIFATSITSSSFRVSWVSSEPVNGSVEYCTYSVGTCDQNTLSGTSVKWDNSMYASGVIMITVSSLAKNTTYYYRAKSATSGGEVRYYPNIPPYPSVRTKNNTQPGYASNPTFTISPYDDKNGNNAWDGEPTDAKQYRFLVYLNHTGAETLVARGVSDSGWISAIASANLRNANVEGAPHQLSNGDTLTFYIAGVYNGNLRVNYTASVTWNGVEDPVDRQWKTITSNFPSSGEGRRQWTDTSRGISALGKTKKLVGIMTTTPVISDITAKNFRASWVADVPIKGSVEYCASGAGCSSSVLSSITTANDASPYLASGAALVDVSALTAGTTYYYRLKTTTQYGDIAYYPTAQPYPSITTKTDSTPGNAGNPTFNVAPYYDKNNNNGWDGEPTDAKQYYFLVYYNHPGAEMLASRGNTWIAAITTSNLRDATPTGSPHVLASGNQMTFQLVGAYNDGQRTTLWKSGPNIYTWTAGSPINLVYRTEKMGTFDASSAFPTAPTISDIASSKFRVSWVAEMPIKGAVEYCASGPGCTSSSLSSTTTVNDASPYLESGAALVDVSGLGAGTTYYYRVKATDQAGGITYFPSAPPYQSVTTKTDATPGYGGNPTFNVAPYYDKNNNYAWNGEPTDVKQNYFLIYLSHTGTETLVSRGNPWIAAVATSNLRDSNAAGAPHQLVNSDQVTFLIMGMFAGGMDIALWKNATPAYTWAGGSPINLLYRTERMTSVDVLQDFTIEHQWIMDPNMGSQYGGAKKVQGIFSKLWLEGDTTGVPQVSDVTTARFKVAWVNEYPATGSVEYSTSSDLSGSSSVTDLSPNLANGTSIVSVTSLSSGTTYYYRVKATNSTGGDLRFYPTAPPYPSVTTKTSTDAPYMSNPVLNLAIYHDKNGNGAYNAGEPKLLYFLVQFAHSGAGTMVSRGSAGGGWVASIDTKNLRDDSADGKPHQLSNGDVFSIIARGLYNDGTGTALWKNETYTMAWDGSTTSYYVRCARSTFTSLPTSVGVRVRFNASAPGYLGTAWVTFNASGWQGGGLSPFYDISMYDASNGIASSSGEAAYTASGGSSFRVSNDTDLRGYEWYGASMASTTDAWVAGSGSGTYRISKTTDGGSTWTVQKEGNGTLRSISFSGTSNGVAVGDGLILYTTTGGVTWGVSTDVDVGSTRYNRVVVSGVRAIVVGAGGRVMTNNDVTVANGGDWVPRTSSTTSNLYGVALTGSNAIAVGDGTAIYSSNWGNTWIRSTSSKVSGYNYRSVSFAGSASLAWAVGERGRLVKSTDSGASWSVAFADNIVNLLSVSTATSSSGMISGAQGTLSRYDGATWTVHTVPSGNKITMSVSTFGSRSANLTLRYDSYIYDSRYSVKAVSIARSQNLKTYWKSGWATGKWAAELDNEDPNNDTIILKANVTMIKTLFNNTEISKAYLTIRNESSGLVVWQGYMSKDSTAGSRTWIFKAIVSIASWADGKYRVVVDAYEVDTSSDAAFGDVNAKTAYFVVT